MPIEIEGATYYSAADVCREVGVSRQTLWRWRTEAKVPTGLRYRGHQVLFTHGEVEVIRQYANRLEPADPVSEGQVKVFDARKVRGR